MQIRPTSQVLDSLVEPLRALARVLGRMAARELAAPLSPRACSSNRSDLRFDPEGVPIDEQHENK